MSEQKINVVGDVSGTNIRITQVFVPGALGLTPEVFFKAHEAAPFSAEWLLFSEEGVPFVGRSAEREALARFLSRPDGFAWWALTGSGGSGKSRFGLELLRELPAGWQGGFVPRQHLNVRDTVAWEPQGNMLWIIDDAASVGPALSGIVGNWATLHRDGPHKVRLLLLERGYSDVAGWWSELTQELSPRVVAIKQTIFGPPLDLAPLGSLSEHFLTALRDQLDVPAGERLRAALVAMGDGKVLEQSQGGNPLLLMLLAAELLSGEVGPGGTGIDSGTLVERHFMRELDLLNARCDAAKLRFGVMLEVLFLTTSAFPLKMALDHDQIVARFEDEVILERDAEESQRIPTAARLRAMGVDIDSLNRPILDAFNRILEIDDVAAYLSVLDEIGLQARRYAIQPDLIAGVLFDLIFNSPETSLNLKRRRGEFSIPRLVQLVMGAHALASNEATSAWARLGNRTLSRLVEILRESGRTIRWPMILIRELNRRRSEKVPLDLDRLFAANRVHNNAPEVGRYFGALHAAIARDPLDDAAIGTFAASPHCWVAPYIDELVELSSLERLHLGLVICAISDTEILDRLTNLQNFLTCLQVALAGAIARRRATLLGEAEIVATDRLVEALFDFAATRAWPALVRVDDRSFQDPYVTLARVLGTASYIVANPLRGRFETAAPCRQALLGLDIARMALAIAPSRPDLEYIDRNATILRSQELGDPVEAAKLYEQTLSAMALYADAKAYTGAIEDLLFLNKARPAPQVLAILLALIESAPPELVLAERLVGHVSDALVATAQSARELDAALAERLSVPFFRYFSEHIRSTEDAEAAMAIANLGKLMANLARAPEQQEAVVRLFAEVHASLADKPPSVPFLKALMQGAQAAQFLFRQRGCSVDALIPFDTDYVEFTKADLDSLIVTDDERVQLERLLGVTVAITFHLLDDKVQFQASVLVDVSQERAADDTMLAERFGREIAQALLARVTASGKSRPDVR